MRTFLPLFFFVICLRCFFILFLCFCFVSREQDVKVAAAGLSDDPLSLMMEERAVARNLSRHEGVSIELSVRGKSKQEASIVLCSRQAK